MSLPTSRDETAVNGAPVSANLINSMQDQIIANNNNLTGAAAFNAVFNGTVSASTYKVTAQQELVIAGPAFQPGGGAWSTSAPNYNQSVWAFSTPPNDAIIADVGLPVGVRILGITWHFNKASNASPMSMVLQSRNGNTNTARDTLSDSSSGASQISVARTGINYTIATGDGMRLVVTVGATVHTFSHAQVFWDRP